MTIHRKSSVGLASLSCLLIHLVGCNIASGSSGTTSMDCIPTFFADGDCDGLNNNEECGEFKAISKPQIMTYSKTSRYSTAVVKGLCTN